MNELILSKVCKQATKRMKTFLTSHSKRFNKNSSIIRIFMHKNSLLINVQYKN